MKKLVSLINRHVRRALVYRNFLGVTLVLTASPLAEAAVSPLNTPRSGHTSTLLEDGKVLISGGYHTERGALAGSELYDPTSDRWSPGGDLTEARYDHTATRLTDGRVLVVGGRGSSDQPLQSAEIYDPSSGRWTTAEGLAQARQRHVAVRLADGKVLVAGGRGSEWAILQTAEIYDPVTGRWTTTTPLSERFAVGAATLLADGRVLVVGAAGSLRAEIYDPSRGEWAVVTKLPQESVPGEEGLNRLSSTLLRDGSCLILYVVCGGSDHGCCCMSGSIRFNPADGNWEPTAAPVVKLTNPSSVAMLGDGRVVVVEGTRTQVFDPTSGKWTPGPWLLENRSQARATRLEDGRVLLAGGATSELYDPREKLALGVSRGSLNEARWGHTATRLPDGRVLVVGGNQDGAPSPSAGTLASAEIYDPASGAWTLTDPLNAPRFGHTATLLEDGTVLVAGGEGPDDSRLASAEIYDPYFAVRDQPASVRGIEASGAGDIVVRFSGVPGESYRVERSSDLRSWVEAGDLVVASGGRDVFVDHGIRNAVPNAFYRLTHQ